jgi:hypothetical protein
VRRQAARWRRRVGAGLFSRNVAASLIVVLRIAGSAACCGKLRSSWPTAIGLGLAVSSHLTRGSAAASLGGGALTIAVRAASSIRDAQPMQARRPVREGPRPPVRRVTR